MTTKRTDLRNIAIIAHVDHGKTTLVDGLLRQAQVFRSNQQVAERVMDSNDLERERGITILAKNTAITIPDPDTGQLVKINIVDTPGHADFGGEVERVLNMVDGVLLLVDAAEGPMPQTRFVLKKALERGHRVIVVINKVDRRDADVDRVLDETFDLFIELGATDEQAEFPVVYSIATSGQSGLDASLTADLQPLFQTILREIPCPVVEMEAPLQILVTNLFYDNYQGLNAIGRIHAGEIRLGQQLARIKLDGSIVAAEARYLYQFDGLARTDVEGATAGDIVAIAGLDEINIGETLADPESPVALPAIIVEAPTVRMSFGVNTSPFAGTEGRWGTSRRLRERLFSELKNNVALRVEETSSPDTFTVSGRGELHLAILIETMRREGYEFQVSRPEVIVLDGPDGEKLEPYEDVHIETSPDTVGTVVEMMGKRKGELQNMRDSSSGSVHLNYIVPTRGLLGFRHQFLTATKGQGVLNTIFHGHGPLSGVIPSRSRGSLVAFEGGTTNTYGIKNAEDRGIMFIGPGIEVYAGMVVGEHQRPGDLDVNICKKKQLTNMRNAIRDIEVRVTPARQMSLDESIEYLADDELLEVTPENLRIRKRILDKTTREKIAKRARAELA
ncbi:MAG: translational GTPase TypA [Anaerolineales bacterium]|nr:translational GTPase TypA [Anaerolineales bacterium]MCB0005472.1 translational GTPase TypA [Anaerolineales bacterium]MCB0016794.1 translational GTPase TypA [Anaerolineales bacterium]MCB0030569.1 translational GTPase TypA [Anaerolineales bacterium]MCB8959921.1 translational GTPase TypA [Ardenticatenales bacterium]